jgi:hypothetical protein
VTFGFQVNGSRVPISEEDVGHLSGLLDELAKQNRPGAASARSRLDHMLQGDPQPAKPLEWTADEKQALWASINLWMDREGTAGVPEAIAFNLRYRLFGEWQDDPGAGEYLVELEREGARLETHLQRDLAPVAGEPLVLLGETWIVDRVTKSPMSEYRAIVYAHWHPG